jgi:cytidylate kinase
LSAINIAIDGPAGAGKSTIARVIARKFGYIYIDTGALYRTVGLFVLQKGVDPKDAGKVAALLPGIRIELKHIADEQHVFLNGEDVSALIRTPEISMYASDVSAIPEVRSFLLDLQRHIARTHDVIMDGRDIGTVVLPGADVKIFLAASPEERARRRYQELREKGMEADFEQVLSDLIARDRNDSTRAVAPLRPAKDAVCLDTTGNTREQSIRLIENIIKERLSDADL